MTHIEQLGKLLNANITEDFPRDPELSIYTQLTADGYDIYIITNDENNLNWENDVYYYEPSFNEIIDRIEEINDTYVDDPITVYCSDIEQFFNEYEVEDYIEQNKEEVYD